ncbi:polygalacturonase At1g48100 [Cynara cardunculus var. scolymus]|uniref:polygalacturonase At1g48100 n=1 Tax=Cynara cardunculus var. scolymus TaxID=59895 RepID=UPI000D62B359|nr:polygalacturonase At1g48100 [Cynara cardunculus var. scolymus]
MNHLSLIVFNLMVFFWLFTIIPSVEGRKFHSPCKKHHKGSGHFCNSTTIFNILSFGAKANGVSDDSKKLIGAWKAACKVPGGVLQIPLNHNFLIKPITLQGPCMGHIIFQIDGTLLAPPKIGTWSKSNLYQWINFKWVYNLTIQGSGTIDGQGCNWWDPIKSKHISDIKPTALRFYASEDTIVRDITIRNSPQVHLKFDNSERVKVNNITISAPRNSPNTDGIHLQNTRDVEIMHSNVGTGDDCVSIQTGCSNVHIHHINCGPGHGISLGGLGKDKSTACVSNILVENSVIQDALYGARIKTWQGGKGMVKNVTFSNIEVANVNFPIVINQYYCDKVVCQNQTNSVAIKSVRFDRIIGTYSTQPIHLACSTDVPCTDIDLSDIQLKPFGGLLGGSQLQRALCWNSYGNSKGPLVPSSINYCLRKGGGGGSGSVHEMSRSYDEVC